jgi:signal transduction histidine kinase/CheY-like chemotaxis protein
MRVRTVSQSAREPALLDALLVAASLIPVVLFGCLAYFSYGNATRDARTAVESRVELLLGHTLQLVQVNTLLLDRLRERFDGLDTAAIAAAEAEHHGYLAGLRKLHPDVLGMSVIGRDGLGAVHSHLFPIPQANASDRDYFAAHRENPEAGLFVSAPLQSRLVAEPGFVLSMRRGAPPQPFDGIYTASIRSRYLFDFWQDAAQRFGVDETMSLIRADGTILVRFPEPGPSAPAKLVPDSPLMKFMATGRTAGVWEAESTVDGKRRIFATRKVGALPVYLSYGVTSDGALAAWRRDLATMGAVALAATLALLALSLLVRRRSRSLREAARGKDQFLAALSHELRNPLAAITMGAEVLRRSGSSSPAGRSALQIIGRQLEQLRRLVDDLLDTARATYDKLVLERTAVDLHAAARKVVEAHAPRAEGRASLVVEGGPVWADADPARVQQMVENLVDNALKYGGRQVRIVVRRDESWTELSVVDDGEGMPPELLSRLFQPFMQGEQPLDRARGGLGLGLALVHRLAVLHGGSVRAESAGRGKGSTFTLRLPPAAAPLAPAAPAGVGKSSRRRVLVVEDQDDARETLQALLRLDGHEVSVARDGIEALARLRSAAPEIALIDIGLPGIDGYEVARRARTQLNGTPLKLVALSGYALEADRRKAAEAGFDHHLAKPVAYDELRKVLA